LEAFELLQRVVIRALDTCVVAEIAAEADAELFVMNERLNDGGISIEVLPGLAVMREHCPFDASELAASPWRRALKRTAARPSAVLGPPLAPLRRLAAI
jgi:hypothetical protein